MNRIEYSADDDVLSASRRRIAAIFDHFERVVVSVSGGKDSTVARHLCMQEAARRNRKVELFFLDQEAEYQSTIDIIAEWMADPSVIPVWYQVPTLMTNATSHRDIWLRSWWPGEEWIRGKHPLAIHEADGHADRFYTFFEWVENLATVKTAFVVGLRARESLNRHRAVMRKPGYLDWRWTTKTKNPLAFRCYPIYDWDFGDCWKYIADEDLTYNRHYDRMFAKHGINVSRMRVSNLVHEHSFRCLTDLQEFEPETYDRLVRRVGGVHAAALYAKEGHIYDARALPDGHKTWKAYRDYLLDSTPIEKVERFRKRFAKHEDDEETCRQHVKQILINDWENNDPIRPVKKNKLRSIWWDRL